MTTQPVRRGDIWFADVPPKARPVLVLTRDPLAGILKSVICVPITSTIRGLATEVPLDESHGLTHPSVANFDNSMLVPRRLLLKRFGRVDHETMKKAWAAMAATMGC